MTFHSSSATIPAVHHVDKRYRAQTISSPCPVSVSVASVHAGFEAVPVSFKARSYLPAGTAAPVLAFTCNSPLVDTDVVLELHLAPQSEMSEYSGLEKLQVFERLVVARTAKRWRTADGSVWLQIANPSSRGVKIPKGVTLSLYQHPQ